MNLLKIIPSGTDVAREALIVIGGAALAAVIVSQLPRFKAWLQENRTW